MSIRRLCLISCLLLLTLTSCAKQPDGQEQEEEKEKVVEYVKEYEYEDFTGIVQTNGNYLKFAFTTEDSRKYYFEADNFSEQERAYVISEIENLCKVLDDEYGLSINNINVYIGNGVHTEGYDNNIYLNTSDIPGNMILLTLFQAVFGEQINYGLCLGVRDYIYEIINDVSMKPSISESDIRQYLSLDNNMELMDLTLPTFDTVYFTDEDNLYARAISYYLAKYMIQSYGEQYSLDCLRESVNLDINFDIKYTDMKNEWLQQIGSTNRCSYPVVPIRYSMSHIRGTTYPYRIYTQSMVAYFTSYATEMYTRDIFDYTYIKNYIEAYEADVSELRQYLSKYIDCNLPVVTCYFNEEGVASYYEKEINTITNVAPLWAGLHEYVHYLTSNLEEITWLIEGSAQYLTFYIGDNCSNRLLKESLGDIDNLNKFKLLADTEEMNTFKNNFYEYYYMLYELMYPLQEVKLDLPIFNNTNVYLEYMKLTNQKTLSEIFIMKNTSDGGDLTYEEAGSLVNYLIKTYGEEAFFDLYTDYSRIDEIYGKGYEELVEEWQGYVENMFGYME